MEHTDHILTFRLADINPLFAGQLGLIIACILAFVGIWEILVSLTVYRKKAFGKDKIMARKFKPVFFIILFSGILIAALGLYGLDLRLGHRL